MSGVLAFSGFMAFVVLYGESIGMTKVAPVFFVSSATVVVIRVALARVPDRLGPVRGGGLSLGLIGAGLVMASAWQTPTGLYASVVPLAAGSAMLFPSLAPAVVASVPDGRRASALATFTMFVDAGAALGAPAYGLVASTMSYGAAFVFGGVVCVVGIIYVTQVFAPRLRSDGGDRSALDEAAAQIT